MPTPKIVTHQHVPYERLQQAKQLRREMTPAEKRLWQCLRGNRLAGFHFRRQQVIQGFVVDFYCHAAGLVIEVDGGVHDQQGEQDGVREQALRELGLEVIRFRNEEVEREIEAVLHAICQVVMRRAGAGETE